MSSLDFSQEDVDSGRPVPPAPVRRGRPPAAPRGRASSRRSRGSRSTASAGSAPRPSCGAVLVLGAAGIVCLPVDLWRGLYRRAPLRLLDADAPAAGSPTARRARRSSSRSPPSRGRPPSRSCARFPRWWPVPAAAALALCRPRSCRSSRPSCSSRSSTASGRSRTRSSPAALRALADRAGVPVRDVLVADASRRTTKTNAYVSGLGPTRRVVVWDTLLADGDDAELKLIVAHELGHRRDRHVAQGHAARHGRRRRRSCSCCGPRSARREPRRLSAAALLFAAVELVDAAAAVVRCRAAGSAWPTAARSTLTGDRDVFVRAHVSLARKNLSDLVSAPPRSTVMLFTHPTPPERIAFARA